MSQAINDWQAGVEFVTNTRFMGKPVYNMLVDFGALPGENQEKSVAHGIVGMEQYGIDNSRSFVDQGNGARHALFYPNTVPNAFWRAKVDEENVSVHVGEDRSTFTAKICVWYTKLADEAGEEHSARIRVNSDLHVYVDGNLTESGDGLSWESAVQDYYAAIDVIGRHDGGNRHSVIVHFKTLANGATYDVINVMGGHYATFTMMQIEGETVQTAFEQIRAVYHGFARVRNLTAKILRANTQGVLYIKDEIRIMKQEPLTHSSILADDDGFIYFNDSTIHIESGSYLSILQSATCGTIRLPETARFVISDNVSVSHGFAYCSGNSLVSFTGNISFSGKPTGKRYTVIMGSCLFTGGGANYLPGTKAGTVQSGSLYN